MRNGINQDNVQKFNRVLVVRLLRNSGSCSRADLARMSNLKPATITNIVNELKELHLIKEEGVINVERGRHGIAVSLDKTYYRVIGLRITRKYFNVGIFDIEGNELESSTYTLKNGEEPENIFLRIQDAIELYINNAKDQKVAAIGCAIPGPFFRNLEEKDGEYPDWPGIKIKKTLEDRFHVYVFLEHDANAGALAYNWEMRVPSEKMLIYFSAAQGIGAGIVNNGKLILGGLGTAGEVGHMCVEKEGLLCKCGNRGCLELYCSYHGLVNSINRRLAAGDYSVIKQGSSLSDIKEAVLQGDRLAVSEYEKACDYLGIGIVNIVNILNPDIIVIGDDLARISAKIMEERIRQVCSRRLYDFVWKNTKLYVVDEKRDISLHGAAIAAIEELFKEQIFFNWVDC